MYMAGWGINSSMADQIYRQMLSFRKLDRHPFTGTQASVSAILTGIGYESGGGFH